MEMLTWHASSLVPPLFSLYTWAWQAQHAQLFRRVAQIKAEELAQGKGSGMALAICTDIVALLGGTIGVDATGTALFFCLALEVRWLVGCLCGWHVRVTCVEARILTSIPPSFLCFLSPPVLLYVHNHRRVRRTTVTPRGWLSCRPWAGECARMPGRKQGWGTRRRAYVTTGQWCRIRPIAKHVLMK